MEALCDLLFEFSNEERLKILLELEKGPKNLTGIAKDLDFTSQGTSRNVARLVETSIIRKNQDGEYELTSYGSISLRLLSSYEFLSRNRRRAHFSYNDTCCRVGKSCCLLKRHS